MTGDQRSPFIADLTFYKAVLDALEPHIALLDGQGTILAVNASWQRFGEANGLRDKQFGVGSNYFTVCRAAVDPDARAAAAGIKEVLRGRLPSFSMEYPCHSPDEQRWFALRATPLADYADFAVVAHENITERRIAEETSAQLEPTEELNLVFHRFPGRRDRIEELLAESQMFREACADYQEVAIWLELNQGVYAGCKELEDSLRSLDALAEEIGCYLADSDM